MISAFYSDPHFGHERINELAKRPFKSVEEHDDFLIKRYNTLVGADDVVLWLGDNFFWPWERTVEIFYKLNGFKITLVGNHDRSAAWLARVGFLVVPKGELVLNIIGRVCRVSHYPYAHYDKQSEEAIPKELYPRKNKGEILIHGHTHSKEYVKDNMIHVGVDAWGYGPAPMSEVIRLVKHMDENTG